MKEYPKQAIISIGILLFLCFALIARLWYLQAVEGRKYAKFAQINASQSMPVIAPRGLIYDRNGKVLVSNKASFNVYILLTKIKDRDALLKRLSRLIEMEVADIEKKIKRRKSRSFDPILIKENLDIRSVARIEEQKDHLEGVVVNAVPVRFYPYKEMAAHVLGYIGEVTAEDLEKDGYSSLRSGDLIGKAGVERIYDAYLRGVNGGERVDVSTYGVVQGSGSESSVPGKNITLTIDIELQKAVESSLGARAGAVVVLDPRNGEVLALSSHPNFDPNIFAHQIEPEEWRKLSSANHPFMNRAISSYPPGSTFKVVTLSAALEKALARPSELFYCPGYFKLGARTAKCWKLSGHGTLHLLGGLINSCNIVFYQMGLRVGPDILHDYAKAFGLGERTGIDLPGEARGVVPSTKWKKEVYNEAWFPGDSINFGIGQGFIWVSPLQMANLYASIANGRDRYEPHLIKKIKDRDGEEVFTYKPKIIGQVPLSQKNLKMIKDTLHEVVTHGTGRAAGIASFEAAGKTGTAQNPGKPAHAWFVCYAPFDRPRVAVASFVEHGEHGDQVTARIAHDVLSWYLMNRVVEKKPALIKAGTGEATSEAR